MRRAWSVDEDRVLRERGPAAAAGVLGRSRDSCENRSRRLLWQEKGGDERDTLRDVRAAQPVECGAPSDIELALFIPDCHHPFADEKGWNTMLAFARARRPGIIVILGDFVDMYSISDHPKTEGRLSSLAYELAEARKRLEELDALGAHRKVYCMGNHEDRWNRHLAANAPEFRGITSYADEVGLRGRGWEIVPFLQWAQVGKLYVTHCLNSRTCGQNAHRQAQKKFCHNVLIGHTHRASVEYIGSVTGETWVAASMGWLGDRDSLSVNYASKADKYADWQLGFGTGYVKGDGNAWTNFVPIVNGECIVDGTVYRG